MIVTGNRGFVGKHLQGVIPSIGIDLPAYDVTNRHSMGKMFGEFHPTTIIHLAALSHTPDNIKDPRKAFKVNTEGTFNLLELCHKYKSKFILLSTISVHGNFGNRIIDETQPIHPESIYGSTKASAELLTMAYARTFLLPAVIIRTSGVYGPGDTHPRLVKNFIDNALNGKPLIIKGDGMLQRDFTYVEDLCQGIKLCLNSKALGNIFNITGGRTYSINDLATMIKRLIPDTKIEYIPGRKIDLQRGDVNIQKARNLLGYNPKYTLEKGLKEMIND